MKLKIAVVAAAVNVFVFCLNARAQTSGYINCERAVVYKEPLYSTSERTIAGTLAEKTTVSVWREHLDEYLVNGGGTQGYVKKQCVTIGAPPPAPAPLAVPPPSQWKPTPVDCSKVHSSEGCKSFNELMSTKDVDVFYSWILGFRTWVCFTTSSSGYGEEKGKRYSYGPLDETEDKFYLITQLERHKGALLSFDIYDKGILSETEVGRFTTDEWRFVDAFPDAKQAAILKNLDSSSVKFEGVSTEDKIGLVRRFLNVKGTITEEGFTLRTATGRFIIEFRVKSPFSVSTESGYCIRNPDAAQQPRTATRTDNGPANSWGAK